MFRLLSAVSFARSARSRRAFLHSTICAATHRCVSTAAARGAAAEKKAKETPTRNRWKRAASCRRIATGGRPRRKLLGAFPLLFEPSDGALAARGAHASSAAAGQRRDLASHNLRSQDPSISDDIIFVVSGRVHGPRTRLHDAGHGGCRGAPAPQAAGGSPDGAALRVTAPAAADTAPRSRRDRSDRSRHPRTPSPSDGSSVVAHTGRAIRPGRRSPTRRSLISESPGLAVTTAGARAKAGG